MEKIKKEILQDYEKVIETKVDGFFNRKFTINVYRPKTMKKLPCFMMKSFIESVGKSSFFYEQPTGIVERLHTRNPDYGVWDAHVVVNTNLKDNNIDIYFTSILCLPASNGAKEIYSKMHRLTPEKHLITHFDTRVYDKAFYDLFEDVEYLEEALKSQYTVNNEQTDIEEDTKEDKEIRHLFKEVFESNK